MSARELCIFSAKITILIAHSNHMKAFYFKNNISLNFSWRIHKSEKKFLKYLTNYLKNDYTEEQIKNYI